MFWVFTASSRREFQLCTSRSYYLKHFYNPTDQCSWQFQVIPSCPFILTEYLCRAYSSWSKSMYHATTPSIALVFFILIRICSLKFSLESKKFLNQSHILSPSSPVLLHRDPSIHNLLLYFWHQNLLKFTYICHLLKHSFTPSISSCSSTSSSMLLV